MWNLWFSSKRRKAKEEEEEEKRCDHLLLLLSKAPPINGYDGSVGGGETKDDLDLLDKVPTIAMSLIAWIRTRRRRLVFLALCSPLLLFLLFAFFPILFASRILLCLCRRRRRRREETEQVLWSDRLDPDGENDELRCCVEDGRCDGSGGEMRFLLQRYLDDQLTLVLGFVYGYGEELHEESPDIRASSDSPLGVGDQHLNFLSVNMESSTLSNL